jgi:hypothetical protein
MNNNEYVRPKITKTDTLTKEEIKQLLENYEKVEDITKVNIGTRLRYFDIKDPHNKKFRYGGVLVAVHAPVYIVLSGKKGLSFSVQIKDAIFFKEIKTEEVHKEYEEVIKKLEEKYRTVKYNLKDAEETINKLEKENHKLKKLLRENGFNL